MEIEEIKQRIEKGLSNAEVKITGDGCSCAAEVICDAFEQKNLLARQRMVMAPVDDLIQSGELHALSIKTYTVAEWQSKDA